MADYLSVIYHIPLYSYHLGVTLWGVICLVPHPSWGKYGELAINFIYLLPVRIAVGILFPERVAIKRVRGRIRLTRNNKYKPSRVDHQAAAAAVISSIHF